MRRFLAGCGAAVFAALVIGVPVAATAAPTPFMHRFALELDGRAPYYALVVPPAVYAASRRPDLGDVRVFNGAGEPVPYSLDEPTAHHAPALRPVNWFPLPPNAANSSAATAGVSIAQDGTLRFTAAAPKPGARDADLLDLGPAPQHVGALLIHVREDSYEGRVHVDASTDLQTWRPVADASILEVNHDGERLAQERVSLDGLGQRERYLRLRWLGGEPEIASMNIELYPDEARPSDGTRQWREGLVAHTGDGAGVYLFETGGAYPVDRLRIDVPQPNTVARATVYSRSGADAPWREIAHALLFRVAQRGEARNPPLEFAPDTDGQWRIVVDMRNGGLGNGMPSAAVGWQPARLTFVARGAGPFSLAVGNARVAPAAQPRADIVVGEGGGGIEAAHLGAALPVDAGEARRAAGNADSVRQYVLWGALLLALAVLAAMAWRLLRPHDPARE
jgi:hypothetical protein